MRTWKKYACCLLLTLALFEPGCSTVAPHVVKARQPSLDVVPDARGNLQNSGALWFTNLVSGGLTNRCLVVTESAHARYVALVARWGSRFVPPLTATGGVWQVQVSPYPLWAVTKPRVVDWATMNKWESNPPAQVSKPWWKNWWPLWGPLAVFVAFCLFHMVKEMINPHVIERK